jgi:hypothetical protein
MILVADEGIDAAIDGRLRLDGHRVWYVAELSPSMPDEEVLALTVERAALLITADKDFGALVFQQRRATSGVMLLRLAGMAADDKAAIVGDTVAAHEEQLLRSFTVVTPRRVRIRK